MSTPKCIVTEGGSTGKGFHVGPGLFKKGYPTNSNDSCEDVVADPGEVVAVLSHGSPYRFSRWVRGTPEAVVDMLRKHGRHELAAEVEAATLPTEPIPMLAHALGITPGRLAAALVVAQLEVGFNPDVEGERK